MENKRTAVDWLFDKITQNAEIRWRGTQYVELFQQAKAMEKEQIMNSFNTAIKHQRTRDLHLNAEQYYNETYNVKEN